MSPSAGLTSTARGTLRETPTLLPCLAALLLFVVWASDQAGYPLTHWAPGALVLMALLAIALLGSRRRLGEVPRTVWVALACLALYTALSFLSILWAQAQGDAWEGANRTLLYFVVFALFSLWPQQGRGAALLLGAWVLAMIALAVFVLLHLSAAGHLAALFGDGRLRYPGQYENASAATWGMAAFPALLLAAGDRIHWAVRGVFAAGTVLLAGLALFSLSRGALYSTPVMLVLLFALLPGRLRLYTVLLPVAAAVGAVTPSILRVGDRLLHGGDAKAAMHTATLRLLLAAVVVGALVALGCKLQERSLKQAPALAEGARRALGVVAVATLVAILAGGWVAAGNPIERIEHGWETFKGGYAADRSSGSRLTSGLGSDRYDFYRVALDEFTAHPIAGIGADNFEQQYLARGHGSETPHYPHSVELRTLTQTGLIGAALALVGLVAALLAAARAIFPAVHRRRDPLAATIAGAALAGFAYWVVHGSFDWFWEFAGLGGPAFALLGLACALGGRARARSGGGEDGEDGGEGEHEVAKARQTPAATEPHRWAGERVRGRAGRRRIAPPALLAAVAGGVVALAAAVSLLTPWLSQLRIQSAVRVWPTAPRHAYADLEDAASLNPLSDEAFSLSGSIALRFGDLDRARREFSRALERDPHDVYPTLELGAIASAQGRQQRAVRLFERAAHLAPRAELIREGLSYVRSGHRVSIEQLNRSILLKARKLA
jgi:tetratricopeptide (TPR) repeat protein